LNFPWFEADIWSTSLITRGAFFFKRYMKSFLNYSTTFYPVKISLAFKAEMRKMAEQMQFIIQSSILNSQAFLLY